MSVKNNLNHVKRARSFNKDVFTPYIVLQDKHCFKPAAYQLRKLGLTLKTDYECKRNFLRKPHIISVVLILYLVKCSLYLKSKDRMISVYFGEFSQFMGLSFHFDGVTLLFYSMILISQLMYWSNSLQGIEPTFMRVFQMISGMITPSAVGLVEFSQVKSIIKRTRLLFYLMDVVLNFTVPVLGSFMVLAPYYLYCTPFELIIYGIPNALHFMLSCYYCGINFYQFVYFYLICYYLKLKIRFTNKRILTLMHTKQFGKIQSLLRVLNNCYIEIVEYNKTYFAKFLLLFWLTIGSIFVLLLFGAIFQDQYVIYKILFYYTTVLFAGCIGLVIFTASSLNIEAQKTYKILNSLLSTHYNHPFFRKLTSLYTKFKVLFKD